MGRRISVGENSVVKMKVFFRSPPKKQAIYGECPSAPSKKRVKMQSQLVLVRVFLFEFVAYVALGCLGMLWAALGCFGLLWVALGS